MCNKSLLKTVCAVFFILILPLNTLVLSPMARKKVAPLIVFLFCVLSVLSVSIRLAAAFAPEVTHCRLDIVIDPATSKVRGVMDLSAEAGRELVIYPNEARITELRINGKKADIEQIRNMEQITLRATGPIRLQYEKTIKNSEDNLLSDKDIILKDGWYPVVDGFCTYEVHAVLPGGFIVVSEGELNLTAPEGGKTLFKSGLDRPYSDAISLVASRRFIVARDILDDIDIYTYFFKEDAGQSMRFIEATKHYLTMYQSLIGKYPYKRFSIVENAMPSAFSMPTFVLMSQSYIRKENIEDTALGHEIVHQWFGNSVFADYERGNWHEGLTIYFADHLYEEQKKEDKNCRKRILIGFENYVTEKNVFPLSKFIERFDYTSRSIGYGKSAMVFHMLRMQYGDDSFYKAIRLFVQDNSFRVASWKDLQRAFETTTGENLTYYFQQWVYDVGVPDLNIADMQTLKRGNQYETSFTVRQKKTNYRLFVPVTFYFKDGKRTERLTIRQERNNFKFVFDAPPMEIILDERYDVFRKLTLPEIPPTIERLITDEKSIIVSSPSNMPLYAGLAKAFDNKGAVSTFLNQRADVSRKFVRGEGFGRKVYLDPETKGFKQGSNREFSGKDRNKRRITAASISAEGAPALRRQRLERKVTRLKDEDLATASLLIMGQDNPLLRRLGIEMPPINAGFFIVVTKNPYNQRKVAAVVSGKSREEIDMAQRQITDYRKYSILTFDKGKLVSKTVDKADNGIRVVVTRP